MYYNSYPYYVYPPHYPVWLMAQHVATPSQRQIAMPTNEPNRSPFPPVNIQKLETSVKQMQNIVQQVQLLLDKIAKSEQFAHELMNEAQRSNQAAVDQLIKSVGITLQFEAKYTPDGIRIVFTEKNCCSLTLILQW
ncbi:hypothetical protein [Lysinibacillus sp. LZ02]|uniref:hypothetical protein n=1 Tax=Lysinibacillus sp. LZ02 TaxID=3420668 RepID=UPI003D36CA98